MTDTPETRLAQARTMVERALSEGPPAHPGHNCRNPDTPCDTLCASYAQWPEFSRNILDALVSAAKAEGYQDAIRRALTLYNKLVPTDKAHLAELLPLRDWLESGLADGSGS